MYAFLRAIGLTPLEFSVAATMTGQTAPYIGDVLDAAFESAQAIVVLFTPDDEARLRPHHVAADDPQHERDFTPQSRPNVIFEAGMAIGRCPKRTIFVEVGTLRPFSDVAGRHTIRLTNDSKRRQELAMRLRQAGCRIDLSGSEWHRAGNFSLRSPRKAAVIEGSAVSTLPIKRVAKDAPRPFLTIDRYSGVWEEDDEYGQEYLVETLHVVNIGDEAAISIQIAPITILGRTASLLATPPTLAPAKDTDIRILNLKYVLDGVRDRTPKAKGQPLVVRLPLTIEYRDRYHKLWKTEHALVLSARGINIQLVHPNDPQVWTDTSKLKDAAVP